MASSILRTLSAWRSSRDGQIQLAQLGDAVDAARHLVAEILADLFERGGGVFDHIVQEPGLQAHHVHVHVGQLAGHQQRMDHVGLAGDALLALVAIGREAIGAFQRRQVLVGPQFVNARLQLAVKLSRPDRRLAGGGACTTAESEVCGSTAMDTFSISQMKSGARPGRNPILTPDS